MATKLANLQCFVAILHLSQNMCFRWLREIMLAGSEGRGVYIYFCHAEIFKSGYFMQIYSNQSVLCRNIGQVPLRVTQSCAADYLDRTKPKQTPPECPAAMKRQVTL